MNDCLHFCQTAPAIISDLLYMKEQVRSNLSDASISAQQAI